MDWRKHSGAEDAVHEIVAGSAVHEEPEQVGRAEDGMQEMGMVHLDSEAGLQHPSMP